MLTLVLLGCSFFQSPTAPTPSPGQQPISVADIWWDYESNEARANETWKDSWLYLYMPRVDKVEAVGKVRYNMDGFGLQYIQMDFRDESEALSINMADSVTASCLLDGFILNTWLWVVGRTTHQASGSLTLESYAEWCGGLDGGGDLRTWSELRDWSADQINRHQRVEPPEALKEYHAARIKVYEEGYSTADDMPPSDTFTDRELVDESHIAAAANSYTAAKLDPPPSESAALQAATNRRNLATNNDPNDQKHPLGVTLASFILIVLQCVVHDQSGHHVLSRENLQAMLRRANQQMLLDEFAHQEVQLQVEAALNLLLETLNRIYHRLGE